MPGLNENAAAYTYLILVMTLIIVNELVGDARMRIYHVFEIVLVVLVLGMLVWWWVKISTGLCDKGG